MSYIELKARKAVAQFLKYFIGAVIKPENNPRKFARRIQSRHQKFWRAADAEKVRNTIMSSEDPLEKWKDIENWQRKLSNKYNAREFARWHGAKVADLYWKGRDCDTIDFSKLPHSYVIRPTVGHSLSQVFLMCESVNLFDAKTYSNEDIRKILTDSMQTNDNVEFLIEEFLRTEKGEYTIPQDYKFHMFNGHIACIQVINRDNVGIRSSSWYDEDWQQMDNFTANYPDLKNQLPPKCFTEMKQAAIQLSLSYEIFCRIDFYATDKGAVFGEFTPTPGLGKGYTPKGNKLLAAYWDKFCKGLI